MVLGLLVLYVILESPERDFVYLCLCFGETSDCVSRRLNFLVRFFAFPESDAESDRNLAKAWALDPSMQICQKDRDRDK